MDRQTFFLGGWGKTRKLHPIFHTSAFREPTFTFSHKQGYIALHICTRILRNHTKFDLVKNHVGIKPYPDKIHLSFSSATDLVRLSLFMLVNILFSKIASHRSFHTDIYASRGPTYTSIHTARLHCTPHLYQVLRNHTKFDFVKNHVGIKPYPDKIHLII